MAKDKKIVTEDAFEATDPKAQKKAAKAAKKATRAQWYVKLIGIFAPIAAIVFAILAGTKMGGKESLTAIIFLVLALVFGIATMVLVVKLPQKKQRNKFRFGMVLSIISLVTCVFPASKMVSGFRDGSLIKHLKTDEGESGSNDGTNTEGGGSGEQGGNHDDETTGLLFNYTIQSDDTYKVTSLTTLGKSSENLTIPAIYEGKSVTSIVDSLFKNNSVVKEVSLPNSISELSKTLFQGAVKLESVKLPNSITEIPNNTFNGCIALKSIDIPNSVEKIGEYTFAMCTSLGSSAADGEQAVKFGAGLKTIMKNAFATCTSLKTIVFPDNLEVIDSAVFNGCSALKNVTFGTNAPTVGYNAFYNCESINWNKKDNTDYLGNSSTPYLVCFGGSLSTNLSIEAGCKVIADYAFADNSYIKTVSVPTSVTVIGLQSFARSAVRTVTFASGSQLKSIKNGAFHFSSLANINLPEGLVELVRPFDETSIETLYLPSTVAITVSGDRDLFLQMKSLRDIQVAPSHPDFSSKDGLLYTKDGKELVRAPIGQLTGNFYVPSGTTKMHTNAIMYPESYVYITLPVTINELARNCLYDRSNNSRGDNRNIRSVTYEGTTSQWASIVKDPNWCGISSGSSVSDMAFHSITCNDGSVPLY